MSDNATLTAIIVNYRTPAYAVECVRSLAAERAQVPGLDVILIDNASGDGSPEIMAEALADLIAENFVTLLPLGINGGFGWANNQAMLRLFRRTQPPEFILLINPDCKVEPGAVRALRDELVTHPRCAVAGSQLLNPDGSWTGSAFRFPTVGRELLRGAGIAVLGKLLGIEPTLITSDTPVDSEWVTGASCLFRASALQEQGLFDDGFFLYFEEVELMFRLRKADWSIRHVPHSRVYHIGGASTGLREGKALTAPSFPLYWYQSRRRFLTLAYGPLRAWAASAAWLAGTALRRLVALVQPSRSDPSIPADRRQMLVHGLRADAADRRPAIARAGDPLDAVPSWMTMRDQA